MTSITFEAGQPIFCTSAAMPLFDAAHRLDTGNIETGYSPVITSDDEPAVVRYTRMRVGPFNA